MIDVVAAVLLSAGPTSTEVSHLVYLARELNRPCLESSKCASTRGSFFSDEVLEPVMVEVLHYSQELNVPAYWFLAHIQEQSEFVSDAVSKHNGLTPNKLHPWSVPPRGRKNFCGLDFGLAQLHSPNQWGRQCTASQVQALRDPVSNVRAFGEWMLRHVDLCRKYKNTQCRLMLKETGAPVMRRLGHIKKLLHTIRSIPLGRKTVLREQSR